MAISDFVMLHNKASEGLVKTDRSVYDIYAGITDTKVLFLKYCKPFEQRLRSMVPTHRVVPTGDGEESTTVSILGFLIDPKAKGKKTFGPQKVEMQFLENHKLLYLELHREFGKSEYAPQSEASLQNFKTLLMLEISLLMGCDLDWATSSIGHAVNAGPADPPVLTAGSRDADADGSSDSEASHTGDTRGKCDNLPEPASDSTRVGAAANAPRAAAAAVSPAASAAAGPGPAAPPVADVGGDCVLPDMGDFTTWQPGTWGSVDFDKIQLPSDPMLSICSVHLRS